MNNDMLRARFQFLRNRITEQDYQIVLLEGSIQNLMEQVFSLNYRAAQEREQHSREAERLHSDAAATRLEMDRMQRKTRQEAADRDWNRRLGRW